MARNPVDPVRAVEPVAAVRAVTSGSTYYRHLDQWRIYSEVYATGRRAKAARAEKAGFPPLKDESEKK